VADVVIAGANLRAALTAVGPLVTGSKPKAHIASGQGRCSTRPVLSCAMHPSAQKVNSQGVGESSIGAKVASRK
jgi:cyanate permease